MLIEKSTVERILIPIDEADIKINISVKHDYSARNWKLFTLLVIETKEMISVFELRVYKQIL